MDTTKKKKRRSLAKTLKSRTLARYGYRCQYCGLTRADGAILEVDHKKPLAKGGNDIPSNLIVACRDCNRSKRDHLIEIPPLSPPDRRILNSDGTTTVILPPGFSRFDLARSQCGSPKPCLSCGEQATNRAVWTSPALKGRTNKTRSIIYPICDDCGRRLFRENDSSIGDRIDDVLIPHAQQSKHMRLIEEFDISEEEGGDNV